MTAVQAAVADLFGTPIIPGLVVGHDALDGWEERRLIDLIDAESLSPFRFQGWTGRRLTRSFGWHYDFDRGAVGRADPLPSWLLPLRADAASFAGLREGDLVQALLIRYDPGAGIGWHRDRPVFGDIVGVSLGATATMRFRRRTGTGFERASVPLAPRSIYHLTGEARHRWEHGTAAMEETRWSVTFRSLADGLDRRG